MTTFSITLEGASIEVTTTGFRGGHFTRFYVATYHGVAPGWFVFGKNPAYGGRYTMVVARPDVKARKRPNWNGLVRAGWRTMREARAVAALLNERDAASLDLVATLGDLHGTVINTEPDPIDAALRAAVDAARCARLRGEAV